MLIESFYRMLKTAMTDLHWFDAGRQHLPLDMPPGPIDRRTEIPYNTLTVTWETTDAEDAEMGSNAVELTHTAFVDFYAEPPPPDGMGGEALGKHVIGDVRSIIAGEFPDIGRSWPILEVLDYSQASPSLLFTVEFPTNRLRTSKMHHYNQPWERWWYTCVVEVVEARGFGEEP